CHPAPFPPRSQPPGRRAKNSQAAAEWGCASIYTKHVHVEPILETQFRKILGSRCPRYFGTDGAAERGGGGIPRELLPISKWLFMGLCDSRLPGGRRR